MVIAGRLTADHDWGCRACMHADAVRLCTVQPVEMQGICMTITAVPGRSRKSGC
jgi:hypothetical protein